MGVTAVAPVSDCVRLGSTQDPSGVHKREASQKHVPVMCGPIKVLVEHPLFALSAQVVPLLHSCFGWIPGSADLSFRSRTSCCSCRRIVVAVVVLYSTKCGYRESKRKEERKSNSNGI